jgi:transcriptional antiterminator RfaH
MITRFKPFEMPGHTISTREDFQMKGWYIAKSKPRKESSLITNLSHLGVETFFPRIVATKRGGQQLVPLFPSYLFCNFDASSPEWTAIRWAHGLDYFLNADGRPTPIPNEMVELIQKRVDIWNTHRGNGRIPNPGDRIRVVSGPFAGLEGIFEKHTNASNRCRILLQVVGRLTSVEINEDDMEFSK